MFWKRRQPELVSQRVRDAVASLFQSTDAEKALKLLREQCSTNLPLSSNPPSYDRIQLAVLKISAGDLSKLQDAVDLANRDWRDALMGAGFGWDIKAHLRWNPTAGAVERPEDLIGDLPPP